MDEPTHAPGPGATREPIDPPRIDHFRAEFTDAALEQEYRTSRAGATARRLVMVAVLGAGIAFMYAGVDLAARGLSEALPTVGMLVPLGVLALGWGVAVHRDDRRALRTGPMTAFEVAGLVALVAAALANPEHVATLDLAVLVFLGAVYLGIPNRFRTTALLGAITLGCFTVLLFVLPGDESAGSIAIQVGSVSALVALLATSVNALEHSRREEFAAVRHLATVADALEWTATHDPLTAVLNRRGFHSEAVARLGTDEAPDEPVSVLVVDADGLKSLNDNLGHDAGDRAIIAIARHCTAISREGDLVGRLGGDEFAVLLPGLGGNDAERVATRLREAVAAAPTGLGDLRLTVSVGVATRLGPDEDLDDLLRRADAAMYDEKRRNGRDATGVA